MKLQHWSIAANFHFTHLIIINLNIFPEIYWFIFVWDVFGVFLHVLLSAIFLLSVFVVVFLHLSKRAAVKNKKKIGTIVVINHTSLKNQTTSVCMLLKYVKFFMFPTITIYYAIGTKLVFLVKPHSSHPSHPFGLVFWKLQHSPVNLHQFLQFCFPLR